MKGVLKPLTALGVIAALVLAVRLTMQAGAVGAGYAAKQICSGVFVARLPEQFVLQTDVLPRLATVRPLAQSLGYEVNHSQGVVAARMLGQEVTAQHRPSYGCTLVTPDHAPLFPFLADANQASTHPNSADVAPSPITHPAPNKHTGDKPALQSALDTAFAEPPEGGRNTLAVIVMHRGEVSAERYVEPVTGATPMQGWSMNKSLMATFIGRQVDQGKLDLGGAVVNALQAAGADAGAVGKVNPRLTLRHLLSMTTGFDFSERYFPGDDVTDMLYRQPGMWLSAPDTGHAHSAGEQWAYSSGDINTASLMWQQSLDGEPYPDWIKRQFIEPLELQEIVLEPDASGVQVGSSYAYLTARDWARMGQLWLDAWHGRSDVISQQWQRLAVTPGTTKNGEIYGLGFWLNTAHRAFPSAPESTFHAGGNSGQFVVVIPEKELVIVRLGLTLNESLADMNSLLADVLAAF
ncbi:beta-lactamase family protein [Luminiphilus sp.]|nr:serine hydrolase [Luminiphilus sp.]MDA9710776.1 beta-lactamase family protein [Luminiphilus sp.]